MTGPTTAARYFTEMIEDYDSLIRRAVPNYDEMIQRLIQYLPLGPATVLELGCGTGNQTLALLEARPEWSLTTVDASADMIDLTRSRVAASGHRSSRVSYEICRFEDLNLEPEAFDVVVSAISLHHVVDKATLFQRIHTWLKPSGALRLSDQIAGSSPSNHQGNWDAWLEWCRKPSNCTEAEITSLIEHSEAHDHYVSLGKHFRLLELAGFKNPDCVWRDGMWGVITADV